MPGGGSRLVTHECALMERNQSTGCVLAVALEPTPLFSLLSLSLSLSHSDSSKSSSKSSGRAPQGETAAGRTRMDLPHSPRPSNPSSLRRASSPTTPPNPAHTRLRPRPRSGKDQRLGMFCSSHRPVRPHRRRHLAPGHPVQHQRALPRSGCNAPCEAASSLMDGIAPSKTIGYVPHPSPCHANPRMPQYDC
jgi:hypothetical protein